MLEVVFCIGTMVCFAPVSAVPFLNSGHRYLTREYKKAICDLATTQSYRKALDEFNKRYYRSGASALKRSTYVKDMIACGNELINAKRTLTEERLASYGFDPKTCVYEYGELPEELKNKPPDMITVSPTAYVTELPSDEWDPAEPEKPIPQKYVYVHRPKDNQNNKSSTYSDEEDEAIEIIKGERKNHIYSEPDKGTTNYKTVRRGKRIEVVPDNKQEVIDEYVKRRNETVHSPISKILYRWSVEFDSSQVVYIAPDADLVPKQNAKHVQRNKPEKETGKEDKNEPLNVDHWNIKVEWDCFTYGITGKREDVYRQLLVFLLDNELIKRYLIFFTDGETCIFSDIGDYFRYWHHEIHLDYYHMHHKSFQLLSMAIVHKKANDPREIPEYYKRGPKKGQVKNWPQVYLSVLYGRVVSSALFAGNWKEAILYLRDINPNDVKDSEALNELIRYIWRKRHYITCTAIRKKCGLRNSSNGSESQNNQYVSDLQKGKGKSYRENGSYSVASLTACFKNGEADEWFYYDRFSFKKDWQAMLSII